MKQTMTEKFAKVNLDIIEHVGQCQSAKIDYKPVLEKIDKIDLRVEHTTDEILRHVSQTFTEKLAKVHLDIVQHVGQCQSAKIDYKQILEQIEKIDLRVEHLTTTKDEILRHVSQTLTEKLAKVNFDIVQHVGQCQSAKLDHKPVLEQIDKVNQGVIATKDEIIHHISQTLTRSSQR